MKKVVSIVISLLLVFGVLQIPVLAKSTHIGTVVEIVDGEAIKVRTTDGRVLSVRLIGVKTNASREALEYMIDTLMGQQVKLESDPALEYLEAQSTPWELMYVYRANNSTLLNGELLERGLGEIQINHKLSTKYSLLSRLQSVAKSKYIGIWAKDGWGNYYPEEDRININTATLAQLRQFLDGVDSTIAQNMIDYRNKNPFSSIAEVKFVGGFGKEVYDKNRYRMSVITNINTASEQELRTLTNLTFEDVDAIIAYRKNKNFAEVTDLYRETRIIYSHYNYIKDFISVKNLNTIELTKGGDVVNVNTASREQLQYVAGISSEAARKIVEYRNNDTYSYKTLMEIQKIPHIGFTVADIHGLEDNLRLYTNINTASDSELRSLFGNNYSSSELLKLKEKRPFANRNEVKDLLGESRYNKIKDFIYIDASELPDRINMNFATRMYLNPLNISTGRIDQILLRQPSYHTSLHFGYNYSDINHRIALYTNINTASVNELKSLHWGLTIGMIEKIIDYREDQPFGSMEEVEEFFTEQGIVDIYKVIKSFIVIR